MNWTPSTATPGSLPAATTDSTPLQKDHHASLASFYSSIALLPSTSSSVNSPSSLQDHDNHGDVGGGDKIERGSKGGKPPAVILTGLTEYDASDSKEEGLLVFGYGCKVFRDDERAQWIEDSQHLIPWMGDKRLLIDRYDCRGALMDIGRYEPAGGIGGGGYREGEEGDFEGTIDEEDEAIQGDAEWQELNEERYRDLNEDEDYDDDAQYERLKRAMNGTVSESQVESRAGVSKQYAAFQYDYNEKNHDICIGPEPKRLHDEDSPYVKPAGLYIPEEIALPKTTKNHAVIEKTAKFIASQGNQMEIILKTKQAKNPLFDFLNHSGTLNPYYKFMVHAIRTGIFRPPAEDVDVANSSQGSLHDWSGSEEDADHNYLHPSLFRTSSTISSSIILDSLSSSYPSSSMPTSQSSRHNAYSMLVSKIKGTDSPDPQQTGFVSSSQTTSTAGDYLTQTTNSVYNTYGYKVPPVSTQQQQNPPPTPQKQIPSTQDQLIIEKMASYVIKNGANFEVLAKNKEDPRFGFLKPSHEYHWYYLNCKERFKAESSAVVASSDFVTYGFTGETSTSSTVSVSASTSSSVKKSATAELAEMKRKSLSPLKKDSKDKTGSGNNPSTSGAVPAESVFSQANLVKEKDKPVIRFSSTLSLSTFPNNGASTGTTGSGSDIQSETEGHLLMPTKATKSNTPSPQRFPISPVTINSADDDVECVSPFEEAGEGNTTPASDDEEQLKRRMERKRKATLFLAKLKSKHTELATATSTATVEVPPQRKAEEQNISATGYQSKESSSSGSTLVTGTSLGDLLSRRLQEANQERLTVPISIKRESPGVDDDGDDYNGMKSSSSSRHSSRSRSRSHVPSSRRSRRSYSSSSNSSSYGSGTTYSKKKSSKRKHKKKKKKNEKSSRSSSRKSKRRK